MTAHAQERGLATQPIRLNFDSDEQVLVTPRDGDRFVTTSREAALACRSVLDSEQWKQELDAFLRHIHEWCKQRSGTVVLCYVGVSSEGLTVVMVTKGEDYRFDLDDEITKLDIELANEFPSCRADVLQSPECPPESMVPYVELSRALLVYGD